MMLGFDVEQLGEPEQPPGEDWSSGWPQSAAEFDAFIGFFQDRLVTFAFRRLRDFHEAEDVIQEVFAKAYTTRGDMRGVRKVTPYLYRMAANLCTDRLRRRRPVMIPMEDLEPDALSDQRAIASQVLAASESLRRTDLLLSRLPDKQAEALRLRVFDDLSIDEIAETQGCSMETAKSRLRYAIRKLRSVLSKARERMI